MARSGNGIQCVSIQNMAMLPDQNALVLADSSNYRAEKID